MKGMPDGRFSTRAAGLFDGVQSLGLVVLLFGLPFSEALKSTGLALAALGFVAKLLLGRRPDFGGRRLPLALVLFYAAAVVSVVFARPEHRDTGELFTLALTVVPFLLVLDSCSRPSRRIFFVLTVIVGAAVAAVAAYFGHMLGTYSRLVLDSIENAVPAAEYLAAVVVMAIAMLVVEIGAPVAGPLFGFAVGAVSIALLMTKSRGPIVGATVGAMLVAGMSLRRRRVAVMVLVCVVLAALAFAALNPEARITRGGSAGRTGMESRFGIWSMTLDRISERPITGYGIGSYSELGIIYSDERLTIRQGNAHNVWLQVACDTGLLGSGTFLVFLVLAVVGLVRSARGSEGLQRAVSLGSLGAVVVLLVSGLFSVTVDAEPGILLFSLLAVGQARELDDANKEHRHDG